jgi:hypothetical protein
MTHLDLQLRRTIWSDSLFRLMRPLLVRMSVALIAAAVVLFSPVVRSASICRWVDANGRTQMSDVVPEEFKQSATCSDSRKYELSPQQQLEAERRVAEQQSRLHPKIIQPPTQAASSAPGITREQSMPIAKRPIEVITDTTNCQARWRIYDESVACFGPYRTTQGATKPEGFDNCNDIPSPEIKCGPRRN